MNSIVKQYIPAIDWLGDYDRWDLSGDLTAGIITTLLLIPQDMAYSMLAGLPPKVGVDVLALCIDKSLFFANAQYLENFILSAIA